MGITCRVYCNVTKEESHVKLRTALVTVPLPSQVSLVLRVARHAWHDMTDKCVRS